MTHASDVSRRRWLAAFVVVLLAAAPNAWITIESPEAVGEPRLAQWWGLYGAFLAAFLANAIWVAPGDRRVVSVVLLALQTALALGANRLIPTVIGGVATGGALLVVVAAQLSRLPHAAALLWVLFQHAALLAIYLDAWPPSIAWSAGIAYTVFSLVMLSLERQAERERALRSDLARSLADLTATRRLLEAGARDAERVRIARELHDLLGHHLVALSLRLEAAHHADDRALRGAVEQARALTRLLLADLRAVVADLRDPPPIDLPAALRDLAGVDHPPRVSVSVEEGCETGGTTRAAALLRCAQEAVTNARKHARATRIVLSLSEDELTIADDGIGGPIREGFGIRGMRERAAALAGTVTIEHPGPGTIVRVRIPRAPDARPDPAMPGPPARELIGEAGGPA